jgi:hypothetical protein
MAKPINGIPNIPGKNAQSVWKNVVRIGMAMMRFYKGIVPFKYENRLLTNGRMPRFH